MKKYAILVAGGSGSRMNASIPKQFLLLHNKPLIYYTINTFLSAFKDVEIVLVLPEEHVDTGANIISNYFSDKKITIAIGGKTRFDSVKNGLNLVTENSIVFVHDAVRCLVSTDLITRSYHQAVEKGNAIPAIASKDSVRIVTGDANKSIDRTTVKQIQTPQVFKSEILLPAFETTFQTFFTDEASVVEYCGHSIYLIEGEENNIKITHPIDLLIAEKLMA
ncbi:MAG: 2-C-methyl-D-erythritol 4-phosphate cytidylyltransferase [Sphingobacteriales bacterium]|nr:2-C-methyl-D-erythritol 4-phosphate cytidylyltransferase [Sphingobacteriales bacterium]